MQTERPHGAHSFRVNACAQSDRSPTSRNDIVSSLTMAAASCAALTTCTPASEEREHRGVDPLLGAAALKAGLCLSHAVLDSLDAVPARQCPPRSHAPALQDDIGVDEDRADVAWHAGSQLHRRLDPVVPEEIGQVIHA